MRLKIVISLLLAGLAITGCNRSLNSIAPRTAQPQSLPSAPVESVMAGELPPPSNQTYDSFGNPTNEIVTGEAPMSPAIQEDTQVASNTQIDTTGEPVTREGVSGAWNVASDNPDCRMILAFTKWSGGYRAATKRCTSPELIGISAWDVKGQQLVLMDGGGNTVARLYHSGGERYDGTTNSGQTVSFTR